MIKRDRLFNALTGIRRYEKNPLLEPDKELDYGVYNGDVILAEGVFHAVLRCEKSVGEGKTRSRIDHYTSLDGYLFERAACNPLIGNDDSIMSIDDPRIFRHEGYFYIASVALERDNHDPQKYRQTLHLTRTKDFVNCDFLGTLSLEGLPYTDFKGIRAFVPVVNEQKELVKVQGNYVAYCYAAQPDHTGVMLCFYMDDIDDLASYQLASEEPVMTPRKGFFDGNLVEPGPLPILTDESILMVYAGENKHYGEYSVGIAEFDPADPTKLITRTEEAILTPRMWYETELNQNQDWRDGGIIFPNGMCLTESEVLLYYGGADRNFAVATSPLGQQD